LSRLLQKQQAGRDAVSLQNSRLAREKRHFVAARYRSYKYIPTMSATASHGFSVLPHMPV
jgi:hypothetical protein